MAAAAAPVTTLKKLLGGGGGTTTTTSVHLPFNANALRGLGAAHEMYAAREGVSGFVAKLLEGCHDITFEVPPQGGGDGITVSFGRYEHLPVEMLPAAFALSFFRQLGLAALASPVKQSAGSAASSSAAAAADKLNTIPRHSLHELVYYLFFQDLDAASEHAEELHSANAFYYAAMVVTETVNLQVLSTSVREKIERYAALMDHVRRMCRLLVVVDRRLEQLRRIEYVLTATKQMHWARVERQRALLDMQFELDSVDEALFETDPKLMQWIAQPATVIATIVEALNDDNVLKNVDRLVKFPKSESAATKANLGALWEYGIRASLDGGGGDGDGDK